MGTNGYAIPCEDGLTCGCIPGTSCSSPSVCYAMRSEGQACGDLKSGLVCNRGLVCGSDSICHAPPVKNGVTCATKSGDSIACDVGLYCGANKTCQRLPALGESCVASGQQCQTGFRCADAFADGACH